MLKVFACLVSIRLCICIGIVGAFRAEGPCIQRIYVEYGNEKVTLADAGVAVPFIVERCRQLRIRGSAERSQDENTWALIFYLYLNSFLCWSTVHKTRSDCLKTSRFLFSWSYLGTETVDAGAFLQWTRQLLSISMILDLRKGQSVLDIWLISLHASTSRGLPFRPCCIPSVENRRHLE